MIKVTVIGIIFIGASGLVRASTHREVVAGVQRITASHHFIKIIHSTKVRIRIFRIGSVQNRFFGITEGVAIGVHFAAILSVHQVHRHHHKFCASDGALQPFIGHVHADREELVTSGCVHITRIPNFVAAWGARLESTCFHQNFRSLGATDVSRGQKITHLST